jgi:hypothetical protein
VPRRPRQAPARSRIRDIAPAIVGGGGQPGEKGVGSHRIADGTRIVEQTLGAVDRGQRAARVFAADVLTVAGLGPPPSLVGQDR